MHRYFGLGSLPLFAPLWPDGPMAHWGAIAQVGYLPLAYRRFKTDLQRMESDEHEAVPGSTLILIWRTLQCASDPRTHDLDTPQ